MEHVLPITKKQSDMIDALNRQMKQAEHDLSIALSALSSGIDAVFPATSPWRTVNDDGVYTLRITVPDGDAA